MAADMLSLACPRQEAGGGGGSGGTRGGAGTSDVGVGVGGARRRLRTRRFWAALAGRGCTLTAISRVSTRQEAGGGGGSGARGSGARGGGSDGAGSGGVGGGVGGVGGDADASDLGVPAGESRAACARADGDRGTRGARQPQSLKSVFGMHIETYGDVVGFSSW